MKRTLTYVIPEVRQRAVASFNSLKKLNRKLCREFIRGLKYLRDYGQNSDWKTSIYVDFEPYSFVAEVKKGNDRIIQIGLILHGDPKSPEARFGCHS